MNSGEFKLILRYGMLYLRLFTASTYFHREQYFRVVQSSSAMEVLQKEKRNFQLKGNKLYGYRMKIGQRERHTELSISAKMPAAMNV